MRATTPSGISYLAAFLSVLSGGCARDPVDMAGTETAVVMVGLVSAATDTASVALTRVSGVLTPENGAVLDLLTEHGRIPLVAQEGAACGLPDGWACYRGAYAAPLAAGDEVEIAGRLADGRPISGSTVVPAPPVLLLREDEGAGPVPDTVRSSELRTPFVKLEGGTPGWTTIAVGSVDADVWVGGTTLQCDVEIPQTFFDLRDASSFAVQVAEPDCGSGRVAWDSLSVDIRIEEFDASFTSYWEETAGTAHAVFASDASWGVRGVLGVFGSSSPRRLTVIVSRPTGLPPP